MKRLLLFVNLLFVASGLQAAEQAPSAPQAIDAAAIAALLHALANQTSKDDRGVDPKISAEGVWQDISTIIKKYSKETTVPTVEPQDSTPPEKKSWIVRLVEFLGLDDSNINPDVKGYHDTEYYKKPYVPAQTKGF